MSIMACKPLPLLTGIVIAALLTGCGLTQTVVDGTVSATQSVFYKQIKTLHLDFTPRSSLNADAEDTSLSIMLQVYQLTDRKAFDEASYQTLLSHGNELLKADLLAERDIGVKPGGSASLSMPMEKETQYVAIVGQFHSPDMTHNTWRRVLKREELDPDKPRVIELNKNSLILKPIK